MEERRWLLAEMHCHSTNSDGELTPEEIVALYEKNGYDILAITDHDFFTEASSHKMTIIPAYEWTIEKKPPFVGHLLIYFLKEMPASLDEAVSRGALVCVAHPATWPWWRKKIPSQVMGHEAVNLKLARKFKAAGKIANKMASLWYGIFYRVKVAGSDAHRKEEYARLKCWIFARPESEDIKQALLEGRVKIGCQPFN